MVYRPIALWNLVPRSSFRLWFEGKIRFRALFLGERSPRGKYSQSETGGTEKGEVHGGGKGAQMLGLTIAKRYVKALLKVGLQGGNY